MIPKNTICIWYDGGAEGADALPCGHPPRQRRGRRDARPATFLRASRATCSRSNSPSSASALGPQRRSCVQAERSLLVPQVATDDQAETDRLWNAIVGDGGQESACGWCKDRWGVSWQITPRALTEAFRDPDRAAAMRAFDAMMELSKIDIARIEAARRG